MVASPGVPRVAGARTHPHTAGMPGTS
ncbi:DUF3016 domain-containing protein, partial [Xanthomonas oryzae pv. oryzae]